MKYSSSLVKKEREKIFSLFLNNTQFKFNEIEKRLGIRSNMVSYHLTNMQKEGLLEKKCEYYYLTTKGEKYLPIFENVIGEEIGPLAVILVAVIKGSKILLIKRDKRPYKAYWSLIGGKMLLEESFEQAAIRQVKEKSGLNCKLISINSILHEKVEEEGVVKHSFILFFVKVIPDKSNPEKSLGDNLNWFSLDRIEKEKIIPSDLWLIKNKLNSKISVKSAVMDEKEKGKYTFKLTK